MALSFKHIKPLLQTNTSAGSRWFSYIGLGIGVLLLLCSAQMYINIQQLLQDKKVEKTGYEYISLSKVVTNESMGDIEKNNFNEQEINELKEQDFIEDAAPLLANKFKMELNGGEALPIRSDFFIEALKDEFLDTIPPNFTWQPGQTDIPVIVSSDFLEIFNVFAPGYGLSQISPSTAQSIYLFIDCSGNGLQQTFRGNIVAFTDRVNSILVPQSFLEWANKTFGTNTPTSASRVFIKTKDVNNPDLLTFLDQKKYRINKDKTQFGRTKQVMQGIFTGLGVFGLLVVVMALMLFSFYLQLVIARSRENLSILLQIGYSPNWLSKNVSRRFIPVYIWIVFAALGFTQFIQWAFHHFVMYDREELS
ncbi:MAG TPA: hypothetical protein VM368_08850, partial [Flavisolibacter sp.]|nr:hypothetical protein [Flavisolibacter sp.]